MSDSKLYTNVMNLTLSDSLLGRQRSRPWTPLVSQQFRLRHVHQIFGLNFPHLPKRGCFYYTLHLTTLSAPFYTSEKCDSCNPKWAELDQRTLQNLGATGLVVRVWRNVPDQPDSIVSTWGIHLSGLVHLGNKIADIQPVHFLPNSVILNIRGAFFSGAHAFNRNGPRPLPFLENVNIKGDKIYRTTNVQVLKSEVRNSYNISKLRKLQSLQVTIKNKVLDVQQIREKIKAKCDFSGLEKEQRPQTPQGPSNIRYAPQLLTMKSVMMDGRPTMLQRKKMLNIRNEIETEHFRNKLLSQEKDKKSVQIRRFKNNLNDIIEDNENKSLSLMESYYQLSRDTESVRDLKKTIVSNQELMMTIHSQLHHRRRQLLQQLLFIYPIQKVSEKKFLIHGINLPNSDVLSDGADVGISVALGYITHILLMASKFLQVPLRYPMTHLGSRSYITDHISPILNDKDRDFPLYTKGKERMQFTYAVYLLNKNIAQLRWQVYMQTTELKATLPNLLTFLEGRDSKEVVPLVISSLGVKTEMGAIPPQVLETSTRYSGELPKKYRHCECGPGLSEILAIPEAFMNKQISPDLFKNYIASKKSVEESGSIVVKEGRFEEVCKDCDMSEESIEQGTDMLDPLLNLSDLDCSDAGNVTKVNSKVNDLLGEHSKSKLLQTWMESGSSECVFSEESHQSGDDVASKASQELESPLTARTDALLNTKSFNLVKTKHSL